MAQALQGKRLCVANIRVFPGRAAVIVMRTIILSENTIWGASVTCPAGLILYWGRLEMNYTTSNPDVLLGLNKAGRMFSPLSSFIYIAALFFCS